jgi:hypothetical protein
VVVVVWLSARASGAVNAVITARATILDIWCFKGLAILWLHVRCC